MFKAKINKNTPRLPPTPANFVLSLGSRLEKFPPAPGSAGARLCLRPILVIC